jgi:predicted kinase
MAWYREFTAETHPASLEHHYIAYRALVRSKISCLRGSPTDHEEARAYLGQCVHHLRAGQIRLVVVGGLPGTGKSTVAMELGDALGWPVLRSDELRKQRAGLAPSARAAARFNEGLYSPSVTVATYQALFDEARVMLEEGQSTVIDASFSRAQWRRDAAELARDTASELIELRCVLPTDVACERMRQRAVSQSDPSDADATVAAAMALEFDDWPTATEVDTLPSPTVVAERARELVETGRA